MSFSAYAGQPRLDDLCGVGPSAHPAGQRQWQDDGEGGELQRDEWGNLWRRLKGRTTAGEVIEPAIRDWADLEAYCPPTLADPARYQAAARACEQNQDRYRLGGIAACSFNAARYLRGMEPYLRDCAAEPEQIRRLNRMVSELVLAQVDIYADIGADGVFFCEDWGTQERLLVSPRMWRELFRADFQRLISHAHRRRLTVWMHSCGCVADIVADLVELGMDVLQFDQPELHGLDALAQYAGRMTFFCPVDIQRILPTGRKELIQAKAREMVAKLGGKGGGFIAKDYGDTHSLGCEVEWEHWAYEAFLEVGTYPLAALPSTPGATLASG